MKGKRTLAILFSGIAGFVLFLLVWRWIAYALQKSGNYALPTPWFTIKTAAVYLFASGASVTWKAIGWSGLRVVIGLGAGFLLGGILGVLSGLFKVSESFFKTLVSASRAVPTAAIVILLITIFTKPNLWDKQTYLPCVLVFLVVFPLVYEAFVSGIRAVPKEEKEAIRLDTKLANPNSVFGILLPDSRDFIVLSLIQSLGLSVKVCVMSEILISSSAVDNGLGNMIANARLNGPVEDIIVYAWISLLLVLAFDIPLGILKRKLKK